MARASAQAAQLVVVASLVAAMLLAAPHAAEPFECDEVTEFFSPCLTYAFGNTPRPSWDCCRGIRAIAEAGDKRDSWYCLKGMFIFVKGIDPKLAASIPSMCFFDMPFPINATADCDGIKLVNVA